MLGLDAKLKRNFNVRFIAKTATSIMYVVPLMCNFKCKAVSFSCNMRGCRQFHVQTSNNKANTDYTAFQSQLSKFV